VVAAIKLGVIVTPATTLLTTGDLQDRVERGRVRHVVTSGINASKLDGVSGTYTRIAVGDAPAEWHRYEWAQHADSVFTAGEATLADDPMLLSARIASRCVRRFLRVSRSILK
jgi:acetyl-CoA synthetase